MNTVYWIVGILGVLWFALKWYEERRQRQETSKFFNKVLDKQIEKQDRDILDQARTTDAAVEAYEKARAEAKRHNTTLRGYDDPDDGTGPKRE